jgi:hypothetical protein
VTDASPQPVYVESDQSADVVPFDLEAPAEHLVRLEGSSDPTSLDYGGFLNLLARKRGIETPCTMHPPHVIGPDGCPRCREIMRVRRMQRALRLVPALVDAFDRLTESLKAAREAAYDLELEAEVDELLERLEIDTEGDGSHWRRAF